MTIFDTFRYPVSENVQEGFWIDPVEYSNVPCEIRVLFNNRINVIPVTDKGLGLRVYLRKLILEWDSPT